MTKKVAALALSLLLPTLAAASDLNPGALQLSGKTSFDWSKETSKTGGTKEDLSRFGGGLSAMYFVSHFLGFGLAVSYENQDLATDVTRSDFLFGPKAGIDWGIMEHLSVFADLTVGIARGENKVAGVKETGDGFGYDVTGGLRLFLNRNVSLDLFGQFDQVRYDFPTYKQTLSNLTAGVGISVYLTNNPSNSSEYQPPPPQQPVYR